MYRRGAGALLAATGLVATVLVVAPSSVSAQVHGTSTTVGSTRLADAAPKPGPMLEGPLNGQALNGQAAVTALGDQLAQVAARNQRRPAELAALLRQDRSVWVHRDGQLVAKDRLPEARVVPTQAAEAAPYPADMTFRLHSRRGASRVIHLDFDGHTVTRTLWNNTNGLSDRPQPAFDVGDTPGRWTQAEHNVIQSAFHRVAEDFAPFDVDVTTEDPGGEALTRSTEADTRFGVRVLITPSPEARTALCGPVAGCSTIGTFDLVNNTYDQPAWVFTDSTSDAKYVSEIASHEIGHNLGLFHDGTSQEEAYGGHGNWAPIMSNSGVWKPLVQWSRGEYLDANNHEDDIAVMHANGLPLRADDHGSTRATARKIAAAPAARGIIGSRVDSDMFAFSRSCAGPATITARPAAGSPNLDVKLRVRNAAGALVAQNNPPSGVLADYTAATGLSASVTATLKPGTYYAQVDGVGVRTPATGYSDYGSRGQYTLTFSRCG